MIYAATRNTLTRTLGAAHFSDNLFATSKEDVTAEAYAKHRLHLAAPKPMSAREKEMEEVKAAECAAGFNITHLSASPGAFVGSGVGLQWDTSIEDTVGSSAMLG